MPFLGSIADVIAVFMKDRITVQGKEPLFFQGESFFVVFILLSFSKRMSARRNYCLFHFVCVYFVENAHDFEFRRSMIPKN